MHIITTTCNEMFLFNEGRGFEKFLNFCMRKLPDIYISQFVDFFTIINKNMHKNVQFEFTLKHTNNMKIILQ